MSGRYSFSFLLQGMILHKLCLFCRKWEKTNHTQVWSPRSSPKSPSQKRPKDFLSCRLYFTPDERNKNLYQQQSRLWLLSFAWHIWLKWRTRSYFRREHGTGKHRLRTRVCVGSANTLSKHSHSWASTTHSNKHLAWKQDPGPLEQQRPATIPPWEQKKGGGKGLFWEKTVHTQESKKGTESYKAWWHRSPSKSR